jgi:hypothetical protein
MGVPEVARARLMRRAVTTAALATLAILAAPLGAQQSQMLIISGLGGERQYSDAFYEWSVTLADAARNRHGLTRDQIIYLAEDPKRDSARIQGMSTAAEIRAAIRTIARRTEAGDQVFIVLIGHGSATNEESKFSMPGPDLGTKDFAALLDSLPGRRVAFINTSSASGEFATALSAKGRAVVTATKTGFERNEVLFPRFFVRAYAADGADSDKDGRISLLEAFDYARTEVARSYEEENKLQTEHALIEDNGDKVGSAKPEPRKGDGATAQGMFLAPALSAALAATNPKLAALYKEKRAIEDRLTELRRSKDVMRAEEYDAQLEKLLVDLALKAQEIKALEGKP